ncbi:MAG: acyltransferase [Flexibacter sp. CG_4_10_14_3_um_filter_32_15]|nr:MAG: acyltransferase [Flavobacteriaceae bacterium CG17_big_fil_post_rev_8_21_14_2_50_33_15]PIY08936.1 MAG: acyltransferase [Flexibacter sp. CG_4_10_14_3_um_filter_32_15]PJB18793.1 MAG: acyltransferase [Flavobacteriaceae bacterium CG_4_9_14_3_um_filter_33_16]
MKSFFYEILKTIYYFYSNYIPNHIINKIPFYFIRHFFYKYVYRLKMGKGSSIHLNCFINRFDIEIGTNTAVNRKCYLDGRGSLFIGNNVSISPEVHLITAQHAMNDPLFSYITAPIKIGDNVWIGTRAIILPGVTLGKGCVVAAGAVVTKSFQDFSVIGGVPAKVISRRNEDLNYSCRWMPAFD